jgi:hypothetical protein
VLAGDLVGEVTKLKVRPASKEGEGPDPQGTGPFP